MRFELQIGTMIFKGDDFEELMTKGFEQKEYFEVYEILPSKMNDKPYTQKVKELDFEKIIDLYMKGWSKKSITQRFHITTEILNRIIINAKNV